MGCRPSSPTDIDRDGDTGIQDFLTLLDEPIRVAIMAMVRVTGRG